MSWLARLLHLDRFRLLHLLLELFHGLRFLIDGLTWLLLNFWGPNGNDRLLRSYFPTESADLALVQLHQREDLALAEAAHTLVEADAERVAVPVVLDGAHVEVNGAPDHVANTEVVLGLQVLNIGSALVDYFGRVSLPVEKIKDPVFNFLLLISNLRFIQVKPISSKADTCLDATSASRCSDHVPCALTSGRPSLIVVVFDAQLEVDAVVSIVGKLYGEVAHDFA